MNASEEGRAPGALLAERGKRIQDAACLQQPDRVPISLPASYLLAQYGGVSNQEIQDDAEKHQEILERFACEFEPDNVSGVVMNPGPSLALGDRMTAWPGYGLPDSGQFQFVEAEFMKAEDYPAFLRDPSDWVIRTYLPRAFARLEGLSSLPPIGMWAFGLFNLDNLTLYGSPDAAAAMTALGEAIKVAGGETGCEDRLDEADGRHRLPAGLPCGNCGGSTFRFHVGHASRHARDHARHDAQSG